MKESAEKLSIAYTVKGRLPRLPFTDMKDAVLGKSYSLSVAVVGKDRMRKLNLAYRGKDYATDILSFPIGENSGEIILNPDKVREKSKLHERTYENYLGLLFIHGLVHLKGFSHGSTMEREETKFRKMFRI